jgi:hypothetical protein
VAASFIPICCCSNSCSLLCKPACRNLTIIAHPAAPGRPQVVLKHHIIELCADCTLQLTGISIVYEQTELPPGTAAAAVGSRPMLPPGLLALAVVLPVVVTGAALQSSCSNKHRRVGVMIWQCSVQQPSMCRCMHVSA